MGVASSTLYRQMHLEHVIVIKWLLDIVPCIHYTVSLIVSVGLRLKQSSSPPSTLILSGELRGEPCRTLVGGGLGRHSLVR
jgi:hypothetical protein